MRVAAPVSLSADSSVIHEPDTVAFHVHVGPIAIARVVVTPLSSTFRLGGVSVIVHTGGGAGAAACVIRTVLSATLIVAVRMVWTELAATAIVSVALP